MTRAATEWPLWSSTARLVIATTSADEAAGCTADDLLPAATAIADRELAHIDGAVNRFRGDSELNRVAAGLPAGVSISPLLATFIGAGLQAARDTDGLVDPTLGQQLAQLGYDRDFRLILDDDRPVKAVAVDVPGWRRVQLHGRRLTVPGHRSIDLGATAKALAADLVAARIAETVRCSVLLSLGGDIATAGPDPEGGWHVHVQDLPGEPATTIRVAAGHAVATSSTLRRRWLRAGDTVHHILDPRTGLPAEPVWRTVSVAASSCVRANTYSTAAVILGRSAPAWLADRAPARLVAADGSVHAVGGWPVDRMPAPLDVDPAGAGVKEEIRHG